MSDAISRLTAALEGRYRIDRTPGWGGMSTVYLMRTSCPRARRYDLAHAIAELLLQAPHVLHVAQRHVEADRPSGGRQRATPPPQNGGIDFDESSERLCDRDGGHRGCGLPWAIGVGR